MLQIAIIEVKPKHINLGKLARLSRPRPRLGSEAYQLAHTGLSHRLLSENYLARLHAHIDPNWRHNVEQSRMRATCSTTLNIDADKNGTVIALVVAANTCPQRLLAAATATMWACNLLPPPLPLLDKDGILALEWSFTLHE